MTNDKCKIDIQSKLEMVLVLFRDHSGQVIEAIEEDPIDIEFTIECAIYWFCNDYHTGQSSNLYSILSTSDYKPGSMETSVLDTDNNLAIAMYETLVTCY